MTEIIIALCVAGAISGLLIWFGSQGFGGLAMVAGCLGVLLATAVGVSAVVFVYVGFQQYASSYKVEILNREYNTNYTREEVFWASDVIETIRELDRKRVELNGDIMGGEKK